MKNTSAVLDSRANMEIFARLKAIHPRFALLWELGISTGLRIGDMLKLRVRDIKDTIQITEQKTKNERKIEIKPEIMRDIKYIVETNKLEKDEFIFFRSKANHKKPMSRQWAHSRIAQIATRMGLETIGTHSMRKTYACRLYCETGSIEAVYNAMGHKRIETTLLYLKDLLKVYRPE